ncbi:MAG: polysaccharide biosynthesis tyrosine autokinase [Verrucomicrobiota bacterium]|nr:polysaccharide biosynthesis tyrosine autokinase [Verrucomicrobiota bacterium]
MKEAYPKYPVTPEAGSLPGGKTIGSLLRRLLIVLKRRWWIPVLTAALCTVAGAFYVAQLPPPTYTSISRMWVSGKIKLNEGSAYSEDAVNYYGTQAELMKSKTIVGRAHARVQAQHPDLKPVQMTLDVARPSGASIFFLRASGADATYPRLFLQALMEEFLLYKREIKGESSDSTLASITQQLYKTQEELKSAEGQLAEFEKTNNLLVLKEQAAVAGESYARVNRRIADLRIEAQLMDNFLSFNRHPELEAGVFESGTTTNFTTRTKDVLSAVQEIRKLRIRKDELSKIMKPAHPKMIELEDDIVRLEKLVEVFKKESREELLAKKESIVVEIKNLETTSNDYRERVLETSKLLNEGDRLKEQIRRTQGLYDELLNMVRTVGMGKDLDQETLDILEHASPPYAPPMQNTLKVAAAGVVGFMLGICIVCLLVWFDDRIGSLAELKAQFPFEVVGQIPDLDVRKTKGVVEPLRVDDQRHSFAESYRNLRSSLLFMATDGFKPKSILVTSSIPAEGKSTISGNLARALAFAGSKVLLVEGDQRRGKLNETFGLPAEPGLSDVLRGELRVEEAVQETNVKNLTFMARGKAVPNPSELFLSPAADKFLREVYSKYDYIIIDTAPILAADDTPSLAPKMDGVLYVVRNSFTSGRMIRHALEVLGQRQARLLGLIYNRAETAMGEYNYYNYPAYYITAAPEKAPAPQVKEPATT